MSRSPRNRSEDIMNRTDELKPCPFCDGEARLADMTTRALKDGIQHVKCRACVAYLPSVAAWNTRATQPDAALREALRSAPIIARGEEADAFRTRQDEWLNGPYRAALDTGADIEHDTAASTGEPR